MTRYSHTTVVDHGGNKYALKTNNDVRLYGIANTKKKKNLVERK